jgi:type IV secretion system protein VirB10
MDNIPPSDEQNSHNPSHEQGDVVNTVYVNKPALGGGSTRIIIFAVVLLIFAVYMLYSIFYTPTKTTNLNPINKAEGPESQVAKDNGEGAQTSGLPELPQPPTITLQPPPAPLEAPVYAPPPVIPPPLVPQVAENPVSKGIDQEPTAPPSITTPPPPPLPVPPAPVVAGGGKSKITDQNAQRRLRSNMLIIDGSKGAPSGTASSSAATSGDPNRAFAENVIQATTAEKAIATGLNNLNMTIAQGKIINAVLETAINTDLPGTLRAIVSRDTYAETGRDILIPKGSRLIGTYNTGILRGQSRVMIVWTRLIRPDGIDIMIGSPAVDGLGRAGVQGVIDSKFSEIFSSAILTTALTIGAAAASDKILPTRGNATVTNNTDGSTTTTATAAQQAAGTAVQNLGETGKSVVDNMIDIRPTVTVDQGTRVNVFVNRDLTFPSGSVGGGLFVQ